MAWLFDHGVASGPLVASRHSTGHDVSNSTRSYSLRVQTSDKKVTVVVADDHPFFRDGVIRGLLTSGLITVVGEAGTGRAARELIGSHHPDVALVDYQM